MAKYKIIPIDLYRRDITVFIGSHDEFKDWITSYSVPASWEQLVESVSNSDDSALGSYWYNSTNGNGIIELPYHPEKPAEIAIAVHEALHATFRMADFLGIEYVVNGSNEPFTYLTEYLVTNILDYNNYTHTK